MNERIRELAEQAGFIVDKSGCIMVCFTSDGDREVKKFAELIIEECADYIRTNYDSWDAEPLAFNMEKDFGLHGDYV